MVIFQSTRFHDLMDKVEELNGEKGQEILDAVGGEADKEKLCSVQEFVHNSSELGDFIDNLEKEEG